MNATEIKEVVKDAIDHPMDFPAIFIWGGPGIGKSSVCRQATEEKGVNFIDIRALLLDPTDLRGIPVPEDGKAKWLTPTFLPTAVDWRGLMAFDELTLAPPIVSNSILQLVLDRKLGEYHLPDGCCIVAMSNRETEAIGVYRLSPPLANRFIHIDFDVDNDEWAKWAITHDIYPPIIGFLTKFRPELLYKFDANRKAFPTPRCFDKETEVLTKDGFKFFKDITYGDEIATIKLDGAVPGLLEYQKPQAIIKEHYKGKMIRFSHPWEYDLLVTPNHNLLVKETYGTGRNYSEFELMTAEEVFRKISSNKTYKFLRFTGKKYATPSSPIILKNNSRYTSYDGMVYCAQVPNHTMLVRRNGKIVWSGNSYEFCSKVFKNTASEALKFELIKGCVGEGAAVELKAYMDIWAKLPDLEEILKGKDIIPESIDVQYATVVGLVGLAKTSGQYNRLLEYALVLQREFSIYLIKLMFAKSKEKVVNAPNWKKVADIIVTDERIIV